MSSESCCDVSSECHHEACFRDMRGASETAASCQATVEPHEVLLAHRLTRRRAVQTPETCAHVNRGAENKRDDQ